LYSPLVGLPQSLLDVRRMQVPAGEYTLEVRVQDLNDSLNNKIIQQPLVVAAPKNIYLSELQFLRGFKADASNNPFTKNGYLMQPLPFAYYNSAAKKLAFYAEVYHADKSIRDGEYLVRYFIEQDKGNGTKTLISSGSQQKKPSAIDALLVQMDISKLESGNYSLTVELRDKTNQLLATRTMTFQRSNPLYKMDESTITNEMVEQQFVQKLDEKALRYALRAVGTMATGPDSETLKDILGSSDLKQMRFYLFRHFARQDANKPEEAYNNFMLVANAADKKFKSGFRYGFETDRGRTYLRFGLPNDLIHVEDDPAAPPYEIWVYENFPTTNQKNVKFLFYNPSLAGEDYITLHSTARGEINNPRWERVLYARNAGEQYDGDNTQDATTMQRNVNRNARVYFESF
ncbi:MAG: GWxTD domain-containing protein, partial [Saprospiraceae bacterium]|nr:GWxTD domain-containing protein [Saprospiraceae bacterium]